MAKVTLTHVFKSYDKTDVIKDISLDIQDREFIVLVGPSGCGKSTVLRMIAGLESITQGDITIGDRVVNAVPPKDRDIAMVFQNYALYPHMNVYDNMAFGLKMRKTDKAEIDKRVQDAARILDLEKYLTRKPKQLSGGQRQRVALGRAIVRNPKVFLMDEPLSNLDAKLRVQMRSEISKLHRRLEATTIYVTHDQLEAMTMGDRIVVLDKGIIQQVDTPMAIYQHPANMFVAGFIGQMNFLTGLGEGADLVLGDGTRIALTEGMRAAVQQASGARAGKALVLGVRPEHFVPNTEHEQGVALTVAPEQIELLGSEQLVHFKVSGTPVVAKLPPEVNAVIDQPLTLKLDIQHATLFDGESEQRLG